MASGQTCTHTAPEKAATSRNIRETDGFAVVPFSELCRISLFSFFRLFFLLKTNIFSYQFEFLIDSGLISDVSKHFKLVFTILLNAGMTVLYELLQSRYSNQMLLLAEMETSKSLAPVDSGSVMAGQRGRRWRLAGRVQVFQDPRPQSRTRVRQMEGLVAPQVSAFPLQ